MALMETHYYSFSMRSNIVLNVFVPTPGSSEQLSQMNTCEKYDYEAGLPVLYLLHGAFGDAFSWLRYSNIDRYAQDKGIVVVMASAENSFYQDLKSGKKYETFFTEELPKFITSVFPVSKKRSKTFIAGLSMGGYGAWYLALKHPQLYAKAASMSGALDIAPMIRSMAQSQQAEGSSAAWDVFPDPLHIEGTDQDLLALYDKDEEEGTVPELYQACGTSDFLYQANCRIRDELQKRGANLVWEEGEGGHEWDFWDTYIRRILKWL